MPKYKLTFNAKSSSKNVPLAIRLAERIGSCSYSDDKKTICVRADELSPDLKKILELVRNVKNTMFEIDGTLVIDMADVQNVIKCYRKRRCDGVCTAIKDYDFELEFLGITGHDPGCLYNSDRWDLYPHDDVITSDSTYIFFDKKKFLAHYLRDTWIPEKICKKYNEDYIRSVFDTFPDVIQIELKPDLDELMMYPDMESPRTQDDTDMVVSLSEESIRRLGDEFETRLLKLMKNRGRQDEK